MAVCVVTYNQAAYIGECIASALAQKTDFAVDIVVGNDCSTDATAEVLHNMQKAHRNIIVFDRKHNLGLVGNTIALFRYIIDADYTYVAMLDGDDYWCCDTKLQRQVDLMEAHKDMSFCYMRATSSEKIARRHRQDTYAVRVEEMFDRIRSTGIGNGTVLHRVAMLRRVPFDKIAAQHLLSCDYPTNVYMARQGVVGFIDAIALYWRRTGNTVSSAENKQKAYRYIDHEVRQGLFLAREFPNTAYAFTTTEAEEFRSWQMYEWALSHKDYEAVSECLCRQTFPKQWLSHRPERKYLNSKCMFNIYIYIYIVKNFKTFCRLVKHL